MINHSCSDNKEISSQVDIMSIKNIGQLATTEYTFGKVIELKDDQAWYKFGDRHILISCKATVKAGVDFSLLTKHHIKITGKKIKIDLPYPTIQSFDMNPKFIRTEVEDINGFRSSFNQNEKNEILRQGEKSIKDNMNRSTIIEQAKQNAMVFIRNFYLEMNFVEVEINFHKPHEKEIKSL